MQALTLSKTNGKWDTSLFEVVNNFPKPTPQDDEILVKVVATALNPVDWKMAAYGFLIEKFPVVLGCDVAGTVESVGSKVTKFHKGDNVFGFTDLGRSGTGTFAEYCVMKEDTVTKKPEHMSFEEASTFGVGSGTAAIGIFDKFKFQYPSKNTHNGEFVLVWGGASSVGLFVIQFAHLCGAKVIATASPKNFDLLKKLGADHVVDYNQSDAVSKIKEITGGKLRYAFDCVGTKTADLCISAMSTELQGVIATIAGKPTSTPSNITLGDVFLGGAAKTPEGLKFMREYTAELQPLVDAKKVVGNPVHVLHGIPKILEGLQDLHDGKVSGQKVVVKTH